MIKDYYKILGLSSCSSMSEVKAAYRTLARKYHPDVAGNTEDVLRRFKEINEAYNFLSDAERKADYDKAMRFYNYSYENEAKKKNETVNNSTNPNFQRTSKQEQNNRNEKNNSFSFHWEDFIKRGFKETETKKSFEDNIKKRGKDINSEVQISITEAINGTIKIINLLHTHVCGKCGGRKFINGSACSCCNGKGETSYYKRFSVKIPAGIKDGSKIRLSGEGEKGLNGGANGDMYLTVHIKSPVDYKIENGTVYKTVAISPYEAVLGANISISTVSGNVSVKISPNTQSGQKIRLSGCGIRTGCENGDMIVTLQIQIPKNLSETELELYKKLRDVSSSSVR